ncbi:MAG: choice-of-anchor R domain-containing protein [Candidatus Dormibacteria bacterium]
MTVPVRHSVAQGTTFSAGDVDQALVSPACTYIYQGTQQVAGPGSSSGTVNTNTGSAPRFITQPFTTAGGQTSISRVEFSVLLGGSGADVTVGLYADSGGNPGAQVASSPVVTLPLDFVAAGAAYVSFPFPVSGLSAATLYHLVISGTTSTTNFLSIQDGATTGTAAKTSPTGVGGTWTGIALTTLFRVFSGSNGVLRHTFEDAAGSFPVPQRWTGLDYALGSAGTSGPPTTVKEITLLAGGVSAGCTRSLRTLSYTAGQLVGAA